MTDKDDRVIVVYPGLVLKPEERPDFVEFAKEKLGADLEYLTEYTTLPTPGDPDTGGRKDVMFRIGHACIPEYAVKRFLHGDLRGIWWEDAVDNWGSIIPEDIRATYGGRA